MSTRKKKATIYGIRTASGPYFYIGSTIRTPQLRLAQHLRAVRKDNHHNVKFAKMIRAATDPIEIDVLEIIPENQRFGAEYKWMSTLRHQGTRLTNAIYSDAQLRRVIPERAVAIGEKIEFGVARSSQKLFSHALNTIGSLASDDRPQSLLREVWIRFIRGCINDGKTFSAEDARTLRAFARHRGVAEMFSPNYA